MLQQELPLLELQLELHQKLLHSKLQQQQLLHLLLQQVPLKEEHHQQQKGITRDID
jgi:hypothetical protein